MCCARNMMTLLTLLTFSFLVEGPSLQKKTGRVVFVCLFFEEEEEKEVFR
jgi:hypothetical protein